MQPRIVVKIGSSSITSDHGGLDRDKVAFFASELSSLHKKGYQVLLVTSGAIAAGFTLIGYKKRPKLLHEKQASASVGQAILMQNYQEAFAREGILASQILLTRSDFSSRKRALNASRTIEELLVHGIVPVINENDTVSIDELKFSENDTLSALVANLVKARQLVIITDMDGLYTEDPRKNPDAQRIDRVEEITDEIVGLAGGAGSSVGTGGMRSKVEAARIAVRGGIPVFVGKVATPGDLNAAAAGSGRGTYFETQLHSLPMKKQWVGFHSLPKGSVSVDAGAELALLNGGKSLLPAGIKQIEGEFERGDVIEVLSLDRRPLGRGIVNYASWQLKEIAGMTTTDVKNRMDVARIEVIHRDEWVSTV
ncbi:glutamate 5-kinase [Paenibacillus sp. J31TS4]|uniref:glutamate 5-kinase n=1 Tax=Paenibacillus sp. J31TS4 TaxID=2807195 RepID=UPI001B1A5F94|nr:glutamate 5-kinase [Paenibacillus sp. J31TS4]GIP37415.1 glutamate 5-kinase [Paenibacillus sp. J31TS4]